MPQSIDIDDQVLEILKSEAEPFVDTPNSVLRRLLGLDKNGDGPSGLAAASTETDSRARPGSNSQRRSKRGRGKRASNPRAPRGSLLPESEYELPILRYLAEHDGRAPSREVVEAVGEELADRLTPVDRESLNSGDVRWKNRAAFVRLRLIEAGDLDAQAPRGTWEITDQGEQRVKAES